jgi:hypothetical protein
VGQNEQKFHQLNYTHLNFQTTFYPVDALKRGTAQRVGKADIENGIDKSA